MGRRLVVLLLLLVLVGSALPAVQAQGISMYILVYGGGGNIAEDFGKTGSFRLNRVSLGAGYGHEAHIRLCFSGSATLGQDYTVSMNSGTPSPSGNCVTDKFLSGERGLRFYINAIEDSDDEGDETVIVTLSQVPGSPFPSGYYLPSHYSRMNFRIIDND